MDRLTISIIIPVFQDATLSKEKTDNLMALRYPADHVEIIFSHGGAKSEKVVVLNEKPLIKIVHTQAKGKTYQLNKALAFAHGQVIVQTDADSRMQEDCLLKIEEEFNRDKQVVVIGAWSYPAPAHWLDKVYWLLQNKWRLWESNFVTCSHVVGPCFAFKKDLMAQYPEDVIADDVYVPLLANFQGLKTSFIKTTKVKELRNPLNLQGVYQHKSRKGNAFLRELLRFSYRLPEARFKWKLVYGLRLLEFLLTSGVSYPFYQQNSCLRRVR